MRTLRTYRLGRVEYEDGLSLMRLAAGAVRAGAPPATDFLFLLEHPPLLTLGRSADRRNVLASQAWLESRGLEVHETDRGGDVTYHGPGQVVGYPVVDLADRPDVRRYVGALEEAMIRTCADHGLAAGRHREHRGCWISGRKIGAVGVHLSRWVSSHGLAFNVRPEMGHFKAIVPCGIAEPDLGVTSLEAELLALGRAVPPTGEVEAQLARHLGEVLGREPSRGTLDLRTVSVVPVAPDGRVLLLKRVPDRGGFWQPVTGRIEAGESPLSCAERELREETGFAVPVRSLEYQHSFALSPGVNRVREGALVVAEEFAFGAVLAQAAPPRLSHEHCEHGWFAPEEAAGLVPFVGLRKAVRLAVALTAHPVPP
ncbi:MAG TPA: lipoyl(octanoyl) transferase LipB [Anaeromyxobacter sp.]|nr:lipoyl(octanoyl) transferase LipB [Anaeromyxobacter sp.]